MNFGTRHKTNPSNPSSSAANAIIHFRTGICHKDLDGSVILCVITYDYLYAATYLLVATGSYRTCMYIHMYTQ